MVLMISPCFKSTFSKKRHDVSLKNFGRRLPGASEAALGSLLGSPLVFVNRRAVAVNQAPG